MGASRRARATVLAIGASLLATTVLAGAAAATTRGGSSARRTRASAGSLTVLENSVGVSWPQGLNPLTNDSAEADQSLEDAIFGELFALGPGGKVINDLAAGAHLSNGARTLTVDLRPGVRFTDGTPFDAAAVAYNFRKDLASACTCTPPWQVASISTPSPTTVVVHLKTPDSAIVNQFEDANVNWIVSPTALRRTPASRFDLFPVGAGPFEVVSDTVDSKLVLRRNPHYWQKGHPFLSELTFLSTSGDESALEDLRSGVGQAYEGMTTTSLVSAYRSAGLTVTAEPSSSVDDVELNTLAPPFNNLKAREALYYATNAPALDKALNGGYTPVSQSFTSSTDLFYEPKVPGYRTFDLAKAKALVKSLGGISFTLITGAGSNQPISEALQAMYQQAGMKVSITVVTLSQLIQDFQSHHWQAALQGAGGFDPASSFGLTFRYGCHVPFSGVCNPQLDALMAKASTVTAPAGRAALYHRIAQIVSNEAYDPFLFPAATFNIATKAVTGPGLTTTLPVFGFGPEILWQDVKVAG